MAKRTSEVASSLLESEAHPPADRSRAPRKAKEKAEEAWQPLKPKPKSKKKAKRATKEKVDKSTSSSGRSSKPQSNAERYAAPNFVVDTSDDEVDDTVKAPSSKKAAASKPAAKSESAVPKSSGKSAAKKPDTQSSSGSESGSENDEDGDEREADEEEDAEKSSSDESGLEKLENKPGALQALFDKEEAIWVDEEDEEGDDRDKDIVSRDSVTASTKTRTGKSASSRARSTSASPSPHPFNLNDTRPPSSHTSGSIKSGSSGEKNKKRQKKDVTSDSSEEDTLQSPVKKAKPTVNMSGKKASKDMPSSKPARNLKAPDQKAVGKPANMSKGEAKGSKGKEKGVGIDEAVATGKRKRAKADETIYWKVASDSERSEAERPPKKKVHVKSKLNIEESSSGSSDSSDSSDSDSDSDHDSDGIDLVLPRRSGKRMKLKKQRPRVKEVAKLSITYILRDICIVNAFPDGPEKSSDFARRALRQAAKDRGEDEMARRLKQDKTYWKRLASIPTQRIPNFRGRVKKATDSVPGNVFNVHQGDVEHVQWLQEGLRYMYPHDYTSKTITSTAPYESPVFANVLRTVFFAKPRSYGYTLIKHFESSDLEHPDQKEIPAAMLALVSTAIYASLEDYRKSRYNVGDFKADLFLDAYKHNITELSNLKNAKPRKYHNLMHGLYLKACSGSSVTSHKPAVSFLNLKDMPDE